MIYFARVINIILVSILTKSLDLASINLTKMTKLHQIFKSLKKLEDQLDIFG